jgi:hypothetical protein
MNPAAPELGDMSTDDHRQKVEEIAKLTAQAEKAYDTMYDLYDDGGIRWQFELAYDSLLSAARTATEIGLTEEAAAAQARAQHIRQVYRHQFMRPPDLS